MKYRLLLFVLGISFFTNFQAQDLGKVVIRNASAAYPKFIVSLNGIRLNNEYNSSLSFDYLEEKNYRVKLLQAGSSTVLSFVLSSAPNYISIYSLNKDNFGKYALILESKSLLSAQNEVPTQTVIPVSPATPSVIPPASVIPTENVTPTATVVTAMADEDYKEMLNSVKTESLERTRLEMAKTFFGNQNISSAQVSGILKVFSLEASRIDFAKFAYSRTTDKQNYFKVYSAFNLSSSKKEMSDYIKNNP